MIRSLDSPRIRGDEDPFTVSDRKPHFAMSDSNSDRVTNLEMAVAHLQHDLEQMHQALLSLTADLKGSRDQMARMERKLLQLAEPPENRDPVDERPPHY